MGINLKLTQSVELNPESLVYDLSSFDYAIEKRITLSGEIVSSGLMESFRLKLNTLPSMQLIRWAWDRRYVCLGSIHQNDKDKPSEEIRFSDACCTALGLHYKSQCPDGVEVTIEFAAGSASISGEDIINE